MNMQEAESAIEYRDSVRAKRQLLESTIASLLVNFEIETGFLVTGINLDDVVVLSMANSNGVLHRVKVEVKLP